MNLTDLGASQVFRLPKIGVRPTVDGRRGGIRESLEEFTMSLANSVVQLLTSELKHANGEPVECVIPDTCIGGVAEAAAAEEKFQQENVGLTITVTPSWCYPTETMDMNPTRPKAIWGFNGTEYPGAVYLAAVQAAHNQKGLPIFTIYGQNVQDMGDTSIPGDVTEKLLQFARAGLVVATMAGKSYLSIGTVAMGIAGCIVDDKFFQNYLAMRNEYVDMTELIRRMDLGIYDKGEFSAAMTWIQQQCPEGRDVNVTEMQRTREQKDQDWENVAKMTLIVRDLMIGNSHLNELGFDEEALGHHAIAAGFQGQRQWTDYLPNGDFMESMLTTSFDWNGPREPFVFATEGDSLNAVTMLFGHLLTQRAQIFADVRTYWSKEAVARVTGKQLMGPAANGFIHLSNSGAAALDGTGKQYVDGKPSMKPYWEITENDMQNCLKATNWCPAVAGFFRGGGFSSRYVSEGGMPVTMARLNLIDGLGPVLQLAEGYTVELPPEVANVLEERTNPSWPSTWFVPNLNGEGAFKNVYSVMRNWGANHCALSYGHIGADLITLAAMLRIPVNMHNVSEERIFRPSMWGAFGTMDGTSADYRACSALGPLYH
ncbi:L-fucose isomerase [Alicyclobacillaceae bacterium I2511]|nr:L-fucose isomerase [Alicyclobacillaceae bacterium I2511]